MLMTVANDMMHKVTGSSCLRGDGPESSADLLVGLVFVGGELEDGFVVKIS